MARGVQSRAYGGVQGQGSSGPEAAEVFSTDRKPIAPRNIPVALRLMGVALGHPEPDKQLVPAPFSSAVDTLGESLQALFSNLPEALSTGVVPQCKVCSYENFESPAFSQLILFPTTS